jgi:hypothetical protein
MSISFGPEDNASAGHGRRPVGLLKAFRRDERGFTAVVFARSMVAFPGRGRPVTERAAFARPARKNGGTAPAGGSTRRRRLFDLERALRRVGRERPFLVAPKSAEANRSPLVLRASR